MKMRMLLLVSSVTLLMNPAAVSLRRFHRSGVTQQKLNRIYDLAEKCSASRTQDFFVEDVSHLTEGRGRCGDKFFCKVLDILQKQEDFCQRTDKDVLVRTLKTYNNFINVQCEATLKGVASNGNQVRLSRFWEHVRLCVQRRNFFGTKK